MKNFNQNKKLQKLIKYQNLLNISFSLVILIMYFSFIIIIGFRPDLISIYFYNNSFSVGILFGLMIIILSIFLTIVYIFICNKYFDSLIKKN